MLADGPYWFLRDGSGKALRRKKALGTEGIMGEPYAAPGMATVNVDLTRRTALVTGAASSIGRACAVCLREAAACSCKLRDESGVHEHRSHPAGRGFGSPSFRRSTV